MDLFNIGSRAVGPGEPTFIIAEIGSNHDKSLERAKELIKNYYGRLQHANLFFTSYLEGWKTDRGMIFMIFGERTNAVRGQKLVFVEHVAQDAFEAVSGGNCQQ